MDIVPLSDGQSAVAVQLSLPTVASGCAAVNGSVWILSRGSPVATIRNARTAEVVGKVDLLEDGLAIAAVGNRVWIATASNKVYIFHADGTLIGALQATGLPLVRRFFVLAPDIVLSTGGGKDLTMWDTTQFTVARSFYGRMPGEVVVGVVAAHPSLSSFVALYSHAIRVLSIDGACLAEVGEGGHALCCLFESAGTTAADAFAATSAALGGKSDAQSTKSMVWVAQSGWITVFSIVDPTRATRLTRERTIPCSGVRELVITGPARVAALDVEGLVTIWDAIAYEPVRAFKTAPALGVESVPTSFTFLASETSCVSLWTLSTEGRAMIWTDEYTAADANRAKGSDDLAFVIDIQQDEIDYLRKQAQYVESIANVFRTKVSDLMKDRQAHALQPTFAELNALYERALLAWKEQYGNREPLIGARNRRREAAAAGTAGDAAAPTGGSSDFVDYWKAKFQEITAELETLKSEHSNLIVLLHQQKGSSNELEVTRAHHICQVIKEKNDLRERERQLTEDVAKLRSKLREYNSPLASKGPIEDVDAIRQENVDLRQQLIKLQTQAERQSTITTESQHAAKHNQILKQRVKKLRTDLDQAQMRLTTSTVEAQQNIDALVDTISQLKAQLEAQRTASADMEQRTGVLEIDRAQQQMTIDKLRGRVDTLERDLGQREAIEKAAQAEVRNEMAMLCQSLDDRDHRIVELQALLQETRLAARDVQHEAAAAKADAASKATEIEALQLRVAHLDSVVNDRKQYARTVGELQGRMELAVEELRRSFTPVQFADTVAHLEQRVGNLFALEAQLRQKDDIIAVRDDHIQQLRTHIEKVERQMQQVSSVFMHLPKSVEEVELLLVEVDEYRRRLGMDPDTQELVQLRLLELQAKRKAGEPIPANLDLQLTPTSAGKSAAEMERLKQLTDAMTAVAQSITKDDKTGLVRTPGLNNSTAAAATAVEKSAAAPDKSATKKPPVAVATTPTATKTPVAQRK